MLPIAFYICSLLGGAVVKGWKREDGTVEHLSSADLERCINGYGALCRKYKRTIDKVFTKPTYPLCFGPDGCAIVLRELRSIAHRRYRSPSLLHDLYNPDDIEEPGLCSFCAEQTKRNAETERRQLWPRLARMFDLPREAWVGTPESNSNPDSSSESDSGSSLTDS